MKTIPAGFRIFIILSILLFAAVPACLFTGARSFSGTLLVAALAGLASAFMCHPVLKRYAFTAWVVVSAAAAMIFPKAFGTWFGYDLGGLITPLIQIITFGMGTTLSIKDFKRVLLMPWPVFIGFCLQFSVMPLIGTGLAALFRFEPELAAGMILSGSVPGGVASNLMTYLAGGNVALSVTMTSCSTLLSPVMTPFLMKVLAGRLVPIHFTAMMLSILNMIIVPIIAGLLANRILYGKGKLVKKAGFLAGISLLSLLLAVTAAALDKQSWGPFAPLQSGAVVGFFLIGLITLAKCIINIILGKSESWMDRALPLISMFGICLIIAVITTRSRDQLAAVGLAMLSAVILHNTIGYILGYWTARAFRLSERDSRTVSFEVGLQNGGMASGLAMGVLSSASCALAPAIFGPWQNISGSVLATWWHRKPVGQKNGGNDEQA
ncbi:bile acid:sodium symporter family protein [bacterium]|nr:bile acid:sodium symporter family protein [bacterium]